METEKKPINIDFREEYMRAKEYIEKISGTMSVSEFFTLRRIVMTCVEKSLSNNEIGGDARISPLEEIPEQFFYEVFGVQPGTVEVFLGNKKTERALKDWFIKRRYERDRP